MYNLVYVFSECFINKCCLNRYSYLTLFLIVINVIFCRISQSRMVPINYTFTNIQKSGIVTQIRMLKK